MSYAGGRRLNPSSVHVRVAALQEKMEDAIDTGNLVRYANLLRRLLIYTSIYMTQEEVDAWKAMPGLSQDSREAEEVYEHLCQKEEALMEILRDNNVGEKAEYEAGDSTSLDNPPSAEGEVEA